VPEKEGRLKVVGNIGHFWNGQKEIILLDNNLTAASLTHFRLIMEQLKESGAKVNFSQGLDIRLLTKEHCEALEGVRLLKRLHFAWDNMGDESAVRAGIKLLKKYYHPDKITFYVLIGYNTTPEEDLYRVEILRGLGVNPFAMPYNRKDPYQKKFARWVNHKAIFYSVSWNEYR